MVRTYIEGMTAFKMVKRIFGNRKQNYSYTYTENVLDKYQNLLAYKQIFNSAKRLNRLSTDNPISFWKGIQLGNTTSQVRKLFTSSPYVKMISSHGLRRHILLFKIKYNGHKIKVETHFYKNQLFYCRYTVSNVMEPDKTEIIEHLQSKYGLDGTAITDKNVVNENNHCLKVEANRHLVVHYIDLGHPFFESVMEKTAMIPTDAPLTYAVHLG